MMTIVRTACVVLSVLAQRPRRSYGWPRSQGSGNIWSGVRECGHTSSRPLWGEQIFG